MSPDLTPPSTSNASQAAVRRVWRAEIAHEPCGLVRPEGAPPCEPAVWVELTVDGDVRDHVAADDGACMWRVEEPDGTRCAYACVGGEVVELPVFEGLDGDALSAWECATDPVAMLHAVEGMVSADLLCFVAIACARATLHRVPAGEKRPACAIEAAERALREPSRETRMRADAARPEAIRAGRESGSIAAHLASLAAANAAYAAAAWVAEYWLIARMKYAQAESYREYVAQRVAWVVESAGGCEAIGEPTERVDLAAVVRGVIPTRLVYSALASGISP